MSNLSQNSEPQPSDDDEKGSFVNICTAKEGQIYFECGWAEEIINVDFLATVLYKLKYENLITLLLDDLCDQCSASGKQEEFNQLLLKYAQLQESHVAHKNRDNLAISPLDIKP